jgi:hypothetical protein
MIRLGGVIKMAAVGWFAVTLGRWITQLFWDFLGSSISAIALVLLFLMFVVALMGWQLEDLIAEKAKLEVWQLRSHLWVIEGGFVIGAIASTIQWLVYFAFPWLGAHL